MVTGISWQRGDYESGRSKNHLTEDGQNTLCGLKIPREGLGEGIEILGKDDGIGECQKCYDSPKNVPYEIPNQRINLNPFTQPGRQGY